MKFTMNCAACGKNLKYTPTYCGYIRDLRFCAVDGSGQGSCASYSCAVGAVPVVTLFLRAQTNKTAVQQCAAMLCCGILLNDAAAASALHVATNSDLHLGATCV